MAAGGIRAGRTFIEMWLNDTRLTRGLKMLSAKLKAFGASVTALGTRMLMMGAVVAAPLIVAVRQFAKMGDTIHKMSARTGIGAKALSELGFAAERSGTNLGTLEKGVRRMQRNIVDAKRGLSTAIDAFDMLGLSAQQLERLSPEDQFTLIAERISKIVDPTKRAAVAQMVFGRAGAELIPLLNEGAAGMDKLRKKARQLGITMSDKDAAAAAKLTDALSDVWLAVKAGVFHIGSSLGGSLTDLAVRISETVAKVSAWIRQNQGLVVSVAKIAGALILGGAAAVMIGAVFSGLGAIIGGVVSVIGMIGAGVVLLAKAFLFLVSPIGIVIGVLAALAAWFFTSTQAGAESLSWLGDQFKALKDDAVDAWGGIADALAAGDIKLAAKILWLTLKLEWQKGVHAINSLWESVKTFFVKTWTGAVFGAAKVMANGWAMMSKGWVETVGFFEDVWAMFTSGLVRGWRTAIGFIKVGWEKLKGLVTGDDTTAAQKRITDEIDQQNAQDSEDMLAGIGDRDKARRQRLSDIEGQRQGTVDELNAEQARRDKERDKKHAANLTGTQADLDNAKAEWKKALDEARKKAAFQHGRKDLAKPEKPPTIDELGAGLGDGLGAGLDVAKRTAETKGTFSAFAVRGMQTGGPVERIAKASEKTAENTHSMDERLAEQRGVVFSN